MCDYPWSVEIRESNNLSTNIDNFLSVVLRLYKENFPVRVLRRKSDTLPWIKNKISVQQEVIKARNKYFHTSLCTASSKGMSQLLRRLKSGQTIKNTPCNYPSI